MVTGLRAANDRGAVTATERHRDSTGHLKGIPIRILAKIDIRLGPAMPRECTPGSLRNESRGRLAPLVRRTRLGFLLIWRAYRPPAEEIDARSELAAVRARTMEEVRLAAEEYHWATLMGSRDTTGNER